MRRTTKKNQRLGSPYDCPDSSPSENMSSWFERQATNHQVQLAATAVLSGIAVAGIIYGSQAARRKVAVDELKASIPELSETHHAQTVSNSYYIMHGATLSLVLLTVSVKLTNFGFAESVGPTNKEDERAAALARRAQKGDYDEGRGPEVLLSSRNS